MTTATDATAAAIAAIEQDDRPGVWISRVASDVALAAAAAVDARVAAGDELPLAGTTLAVKDNIDVAGLPTTAGCPAFAYVPDDDAPVVAALRAAGAVVIGKTNLDQFATGLVGVRSPYGICPNAHWPGLIAGGSSSGSAVAVAAGHVTMALGTDTAGSGRIPAACNGIVGFKPTRGRVSARGVVPACRSLDCVSIFARDVHSAAVATSVAAGRDPLDPWSRSPVRQGRAMPPAPRIGVPAAAALTFDGDPAGPARFASSVDALDRAGLELVPVDLAPFVDAGALLYGGAFVAERYEAVGRFVDEHPDEVHPVVGGIISAAGALPAWAAFRDLTELRRLATATEAVWSALDAIVVPSAPRIPTVDEVLAQPIAVNTMLGTYTNFVNLLDLCAVTVPTAPRDRAGPPPSVTVIGPAWADDLVAHVGARISAGT